MFQIRSHRRYSLRSNVDRSGSRLVAQCLDSRRRSNQKRPQESVQCLSHLSHDFWPFLLAGFCLITCQSCGRTAHDGRHVLEISVLVFDDAPVLGNAWLNAVVGHEIDQLHKSSRKCANATFHPQQYKSSGILYLLCLDGGIVRINCVWTRL